MSLTKLLLGMNNSVMTSLFPPRESLEVTSRQGTGNSRTFFYGVYIVSRESGEKKTKCDRIAPSHPLRWPCVSDLLATTLRVWSYEPFIVFAPSSSGYTSGQNLKVLYISITEIIKTYQEIMRFISRNWSNSWIMFLKREFNSALTHT